MFLASVNCCCLCRLSKRMGHRVLSITKNSHAQAFLQTHFSFPSISTTLTHKISFFPENMFLPIYSVFFFYKHSSITVVTCDRILRSNKEARNWRRNWGFDGEYRNSRYKAIHLIRSLWASKSCCANIQKLSFQAISRRLIILIRCVLGRCYINLEMQRLCSSELS